MANKKHPKFYLAREGGNLIPIDGRKLKLMLINREVSPCDLVINKHLGIWKRLGDVKGFRTIAKNQINQQDDQTNTKNIDQNIITNEIKPSLKPQMLSINKAPVNVDAKFGTYYRKDDFYKKLFEKPGPRHSNQKTQKKIYTALILSAILCILVATILVYRHFDVRDFIVSGTVKYQKAIIEEGDIRFENKSYPALSFSTPIKSGSFKMNWKGPAYTNYMIVRVNGYKMKSMGPKAKAFTDYIPSEHNTKSVRQEVIVPGENNISIDLE